MFLEACEPSHNLKSLYRLFIAFLISLFIHGYLSSVSNVSLMMFADNTTILIITDSSVKLVERNLNQLAAEVSAWPNINRMALNATRTKSMLVSSPKKLNTLLSQSLNVAVNESEVEQVTEAKILGVTFHHTLSWEGHVETLCKKLNSRITLLRRIQPYLTQVGSLHYYNACIHSRLVYCSAVWGTCSQTLLLVLLRSKKRAARIILQADRSTPSVSLFSTLHWIPVCDIIKYKKLQLLFSILVNSEAPLCLKEKFSFV